VSKSLHRWVLTLTPTVDVTPLDLVWRHCRAIADADPFVAEGARAVTLKGWSLSSRANNHMGMGSG